MFVHHNTGEWVRSNDWSTARRYPSDAYVREYASIEEIDNAFVRQTFTDRKSTRLNSSHT